MRVSSIEEFDHIQFGLNHSTDGLEVENGLHMYKCLLLLKILVLLMLLLLKLILLEMFSGSEVPKIFSCNGKIILIVSMGSVTFFYVLSFWSEIFNS